MNADRRILSGRTHGKALIRAFAAWSLQEAPDLGVRTQAIVA